ncbi:MAG: hypothetical protein RLZZ09_801 [Pseudomonadota bacterium]
MRLRIFFQQTPPAVQSTGSAKHHCDGNNHHRTRLHVLELFSQGLGNV